MQGDRETSNALTTVKCSYDHDKLLLRNPPLQTTLTSNEGHLLLALIEGVTDKEDLIRRVWGERGLIVSDSSYYKALHTLRHYLSEVGLDRSVLKTLPRRGVVLLLNIEKISSENIPPDREHQAEPLATDNTGIQACSLPEPTPVLAIQDDIPAPIPITPPIPAPPPRKQSWRNGLFYPLVLAGMLLPAGYAYMLFNKPVQLERWRLLSQSEHAKQYVELGDKTAASDIAAAMAIFGPAVGTTGTNYYIKKTLSELLVNCEKPESKGEALCTNYLIIEQKK
ncbi:winged helix-turn-helix domain-containing protein [Pseudomonas fragi]